VIWVLKLRGSLLRFGQAVRTQAHAEAVAAGGPERGAGAPARGDVP